MTPLHPGGALDVVPSGTAVSLGTDAQAADLLVSFLYGLGAPYRNQNTRWVMNSTTAAVLARLKDADGRFLWQPSFQQGQPATLLGIPIAFEETMPNIAAGQTPIALGDFKQGYVIVDRLGTSILRDPYSAKPWVLFYARKRVGGGVRDPRAIRLLKIAAA